jgi:glutamyl-tRNA reductase
VPRDIDPDVTGQRDVFLYNVDDLQGIVHDNLRNRHVEAARANALVDEEVQHFSVWMRSRAIGPLIGRLQAHGRSIVEAETARALARLGELPPEQRAVVEQLGHSIMRKLLHQPVTSVKQAATQPVGAFDAATLAEAMSELFALAEAPADTAAATPEREAEPGTDPTPESVAGSAKAG